MLYTNTSPPVIVRDVIVVGSSILDFPAVPAMPPGDVRGFDVRTGQKLWTFRAVPSPGEVGHETWESDAWRVTGNTNVWAPMSADEELGYVYLPFSTPANDYDGGDRPGDNLFAETLVCVEARTGKRVWHYQIVRHGVWDYDLPAAPNLIDVTLDGKSIKAVAQVTKQGFVFTFDRVTGAPLWPIEDRPVPQSAVAGEKTAPTQPFPTKPPAFEIQGDPRSGPDRLHAGAQVASARDHRQVRPWAALHAAEGAWDHPDARHRRRRDLVGRGVGPRAATYYVTTYRLPFVIRLVPPPDGFSPTRYVGRFDVLPGPNRLPLFKPPWGSVVAIDMSRGEHRWRAPVGTGPRNHPALALANVPERLGWPTRSFALATKSLLFVANLGYRGPGRPAPFSPRRRVHDLIDVEPKLYAFDKTTGKLLAEIPLPSNVTGAPMTYLINGKQHIGSPSAGRTSPRS